MIPKDDHLDPEIVQLDSLQDCISIRKACLDNEDNF